MAMVYFAGAETGDLSELASTLGMVNVTSSIVHTGNYAFEVNGSSSQSTAIFKTGLNAAASYFRAWMNFSAMPSPGAVGIVEVLDSTEALLGGCYLTPLGLIIALANGGTAIEGTIVLQYNVWYLIECRYVVGTGANAVFEVRVGGVVIATSTTGTGITNADNWFCRAQDNIMAYVDDVAIRNDRYAGDGRCLARQGISGSPTYTAWTTTGGAINVVWSTTPYSVTTYAAATAANQVQSMVIAPFTPGGVGPIDMINSVKVGMVGELASSGGSTQQLFIIFNSMFQGSSAGLAIATAPQYAEFYPATLPTVAQLSASQGGGNQGSTTDFFTIFALWVMADFTPVWFDERGTDVPLFEALGVTAYG